MKKLFVVLAALFLLAVMACSGGGGDGGGTSKSDHQTSATIESQGGTISVSDSSSPINGFKMDIPADALSTSTTITVETTKEAIPLPNSISISGNIIKLSPEGLTFNKPISITIPYSGDTPPTIVTYNSESSSYSILPTSNLDTQNKTITVVTNHFSSAARVNNKTGYPSIGTNPEFKLSDDTFRMNNTKTDFAGTPAANGNGECWGFAAYSQWYFKNKKASDGNLKEKYGDNEKWLIIEAQEKQSVVFWQNFIEGLLHNLHLYNDLKTFRDLYNAMDINNTPQILSMQDPDTLASHAVLVYAITKLSNGTWQLDIYENRDNSKSYPLIFDGQNFQAWYGCTSDKCEYHKFTKFTFAGDNSIKISPDMEAIYNKYKDSNSTSTYAISGQVTLNGAGMSGVAVSLTGASSSSSTTVSSGNYSFTGLANGSYTVTPSKTGYTFSPSSTAVTVSGADKPNINFTATANTVNFSMSGTIHVGSNSGAVLSGATVSIAGLTATTSSTGTFTITGIPAGTYAFSVSKSGYDTYTNSAYYVGSDQSGLSFYLTQPTVTYSMSGTIHVGSNSGAVLSGATVSIAGLPATTDGTGYFSITGIPAGTYAFSVSKASYDTYTNSAYYVGTNQTGLSFYLTIVTVEPLNTWHIRQSGGAGYSLQAVTYGNNAFVAVGNSTISYSTNGANWTTGSITGNLYGVAYGNNTFVTAGWGGARITSPDGHSWTPQGTPSWMGPHYTTVGYGNNIFIMPASGIYSGIYTSPDGITGAAVNPGTTAPLSAVCYGNGIFVVVGSTGTILTSSNGTAWTARNSGTTTNFYGIAYGNGTFVAVGDSGIILTSPDGITWTTRNQGSSFTLYNIAYGNGTFVAVGNSGLIITSPNGIIWTQRYSGTTISLLGITFGNNSFVVAGQDGTILQSDPN